MVELRIVNIPDDLITALRRRAAAIGRGLNEEIFAILHAAADHPAVTFSARARNIRKELAEAGRTFTPSAWNISRE
ncbi:hypothetical protein JW905_07775 [bacterium]|nr:hypothetical protein [candidate division CSSED10-310 bacterium]